MERKHVSLNFDIPWPRIRLTRDTVIRSCRHWLPSRGNVIFTLTMIALLVLAQSVGALPVGRPQAIPTAASTGTIAYQGRLADSAGNPLTGTYNMIFRLYSASSDGTPLWEEQWTGPNGVKVSDGLFNVMLGSLTAISQAVITGHDQLFLGITVGTDDEMAPRVQLGSVPFAVQALTVPDGSVTTAQIADGAVTQAKLGADVDLVPPVGSITTTMIADGAVTGAKLSRRLTRVVASSNLTIPTIHTWYDVLSVTVNLEREMLVTIHGSLGIEHLSYETCTAGEIIVDGTRAIMGEKVNKAGFANTIMMSTALMLSPGQHQIKLRALSWAADSLVIGVSEDARTQLVVIEG